MFSAIKSAYYSKKKGKRSDEEKKDSGTLPTLPADQSSSKDTSYLTSVLMGNRNSSTTPTNSSQGLSTSLRVGKRTDNRFTSDAELSEQIKAERDLNSVCPCPNWFPEVPTKYHSEADVPDHAKSSPVFAQLGNYGPAVENRTQKSPTEKITQKNLAPVKWFSPPSNCANHQDDDSYNTPISPSESIQPGSHDPIGNQQAQKNPTPRLSKPVFNPIISPFISAQDESRVPMKKSDQNNEISVKKFSLRPEIPNNRQTTEPNSPKAFLNLTPSKNPISYDSTSSKSSIGSRRASGSPTKNTFHFSAQPTSTTKNQYPLFPVTAGSILSVQGSSLLESRNQGIIKEREIKYPTFDVSTTPKMPGAFPTRSPCSSIADGLCQYPLAEGFQRPPTSSPVQLTAVPAFNFSSPFSFNSFQSVHSPHHISTDSSPPPSPSPPPPRTDATIATPIFSPPAIAPLFSPAHLASIHQKTSKTKPVDFKPTQHISSQAASFKEPIPVMALKVTGIPKANTRAIYDQANPPPSFSLENVARLAAGSFTHIEKKAQLPAEEILSSVEENQFSAGAESQYSANRIQSSINRELQPLNKGSQPLREGVQGTNEKGKAYFRKCGEQKGEFTTNKKPVNIENKPNNTSTEPNISEVNMPNKESCSLFMANIQSSVNSARYQNLVSIIAELYSHQASFELLELKAHDIMKRILIWFSHQPSLQIAEINSLLPMGNNFITFNYWEKESLRIVLSVSCIDRVSYVDVWMVGDLGFNKQLFRIAEYKLKERGPLRESMIWRTLLGAQSLIMTSCGLFYSCPDPKCETILERVTSKLGRMNLAQGALPDDILVDLFCENSLAEQASYAKAADLLPKPKYKADKNEWVKFARARNDREDSIIGVNLEKDFTGVNLERGFTGVSLERGFTGAKRARLTKSKYIGRHENVDPPPPSEDSAVEELLKKIQKPCKISAASARKIKKELADAKGISKRCEAALGKMADIIEKNTEASNLAVDEAHNHLAVPKLDNLVVPKTNNLVVPIAVSKVNNQLAVPKENYLAVPKVENQLAVSKVNNQLAVPKENYLAVPKADTRSGLARDSRMDMGLRARRLTVVEGGMEFIMEKSEQSDDDKESGFDSKFGEEMGKKQDARAEKKKAASAVSTANVATAAIEAREQEQAQSPAKPEAPIAKQGANANKGKNKGKKGKKGKNISWKRL
ncbi:hypothetical protein DFP73DRAFT_636175 [Morchella snyderi]|nr:hypothetical protein DFP73DRAFT_636175 [Morchella snyderi]